MARSPFVLGTDCPVGDGLGGHGEHLQQGHRWELPKITGTILGVPVIRTIAFWGLYWGPLILGNCHIRESLLASDVVDKKIGSNGHSMRSSIQERSPAGFILQQARGRRSDSRAG